MTLYNGLPKVKAVKKAKRVCAYCGETKLRDSNDSNICGRCERIYDESIEDLRLLWDRIVENNTYPMDTAFYDYFVFEALIRLSDMEGNIYDSQEKLMHITGLGKTMFGNCLQRLDKAGYIKINRNRHRGGWKMRVDASKEVPEPVVANG
jgi:ribosomal protein S27AE